MNIVYGFNHFGRDKLIRDETGQIIRFVKGKHTWTGIDISTLHCPRHWFLIIIFGRQFGWMENRA